MHPAPIGREVAVRRRTAAWNSAPARSNRSRIARDPRLGDVVGKVEHDHEVGFEAAGRHPLQRRSTSSTPSPRATPWYASVDGVKRSHTTIAPRASAGRMTLAPRAAAGRRASTRARPRRRRRRRAAASRAARRPSVVSPGSWVSTTSRRRAPASRRASSVDLRALADALAALEDDEASGHVRSVRSTDSVRSTAPRSTVRLRREHDVFVIAPHPAARGDAREDRDRRRRATARAARPAARRANRPELTPRR